MASIRYTHGVLAWEYDQRNGDASADKNGCYSKYAAMGSGRIHELSCGSGRLLNPLAERGYVVDSVDNA